MKCMRCGKEINDRYPHETGYETADGRAVHYGCSLLLDERPKPKGSLAELLKAKSKMEAPR